MTIYLVRHGHAGSRRKWAGPDELRPLSDKGRRQAEGIASALADAGVTALFSSPFVRCVQTLEPLSAKLGLPIQTDASLAEGAPVAPGLALLDAHVDRTIALCTHGDVLPALLDALKQRGMEGEVDGGTRKGAWWEIEVEGGRFTRAEYHPPAGG